MEIESKEVKNDEKIQEIYVKDFKLTRGFQGRKNKRNSEKPDWLNNKKPHVDNQINKGEESKQEVNVVNPDLDRKFPKKRIVLLFCYCGENYVGLQRNPNVWTIEAALEKALVEKHAISNDNAGSFNKIGWNSAARTDKGVSALGNVISFKALMIPNFIEEINSVLPSDIRLLELKFAPKSFNSKKNCFSRQYHYVCPTYLFSPSKYYPNYGETIFKFESETREKINQALSMYLGTNKYHNFTDKINFEDGQSQRLILSMTCSEPFLIDGIEFVQISVHGQSFVLHQIRNMIALVICIIRDGKNKSVINACFQKPKKKWNMAPAEGLFLGKTLYDIYNLKQQPEKKTYLD